MADTENEDVNGGNETQTPTTPSRCVLSARETTPVLLPMLISAHIVVLSLYYLLPRHSKVCHRAVAAQPPLFHAGSVLTMPPPIGILMSRRLPPTTTPLVGPKAFIGTTPLPQVLMVPISVLFSLPPIRCYIPSTT